MANHFVFNGIYILAFLLTTPALEFRSIKALIGSNQPQSTHCFGGVLALWAETL